MYHLIEWALAMQTDTTRNNYYHAIASKHSTDASIR